jgi:tetratricopeptide (TPR) repeat protein
MNRTWKGMVSLPTLGLLVCTTSGICLAQSPQGGQSQPPTQQGDKSKADVPPLTIAAPVNAEEEAAFKAFQVLPTSDLPRKIQAGEEFLKKYPESRYKPPILGALTAAYLQRGDLQKMREYGEKEVALQPNDASTLAILGQALSRGAHGNSPEAAQMLAKAEQYSKQAIEVTPTLPKPDGMTDEVFAAAKNQTLAVAHSGLGLVYARHSKFSEAILELEQAVKLDTIVDPVNYYLLGLANKSESHFEDAVAAFTKCASVAGQMQEVCKGQAEETKKLGLTQLSAPK